MEPIYLDHNATTPVDPRVAREVALALTDLFGNPSSAHLPGRRARDALEAARAEVAALLGARAEEVIFTAGGTESDNLAVIGAARAAAEARGRPGHVVTCAGEHPAVVAPCSALEAMGFRVTRAPIDREGRVDPGEVRRAIEPETVLVTVLHANNETGVLQDVEAIGRIARERGVPFHTDAAQSVGKIPTRVDELQVDLLTVAGHKLYAPKGIGALYVRRGTPISPVLRGASQERGVRPGTEPVHQAVGLGAACRIATAEMAGAAGRMARLRDRLEEALRAGVPGLTRNGHALRRLPNTLNVNFPGVAGADLLAGAPRVAASTGSACHAGETRLSPVLEAMGVPPEAGRGAVRLSLGRSTTPAEVEEAAAALAEAWRALAAR